MSYSSTSIKRVITDIDANKVYLPALQRKFVWGKRQIQLLFDSLMRNYPIGAFLFWNMLLITKVSIGVHLFFRYLISPDIAPPHHSTLDTISFTFRNTVIYMAIVGIAVAVKMTTEWYNNEAQRKEIEKNKLL